MFTLPRAPRSGHPLSSEWTRHGRETALIALESKTPLCRDLREEELVGCKPGAFHQRPSSRPSPRSDRLPTLDSGTHQELPPDTLSVPFLRHHACRC